MLAANNTNPRIRIELTRLAERLLAQAEAEPSSPSDRQCLETGAPNAATGLDLEKLTAESEQQPGRSSPLLMEVEMVVERVRLTVEQTDKGLRATIQQRYQLPSARKAISEAFLVDSIAVAKGRAVEVARKHGLKSYGFVDKTVAKV